MSGKESISVSGQILVRSTRTLSAPCSAIPARLPLKGVAVKVEYQQGVGLWRDLGETTTAADGRFTVSSAERPRDRSFRVKVRLKSADLSVRSHVNADWDSVYQQNSTSQGGLVGLTLVFGGRAASANGARSELDDEKNRERAELWALARQLLDRLDALGQPFGQRLIRPFRVEIVSPAASDESWAGPARRDVHIVPKATINAIFHEIMHIWAYDHTRFLFGGQAGLIGSAVSGLSTHEPSEKTSTAFHEGFASFAAAQMLTETFGCGIPRPLNRLGLVRSQVFSLADVAHSDDGWRSVFATLTTPNLHEFSFGAAGDNGASFIQPIVDPPPGDSPFTSFQSILGLFGAADVDGAKRRMDRGDMRSVEAFLDRVIAVFRGKFVGTKDQYLRLFDPGETVEPAELFPA
jgi:hypothetical protein